MWNVNYKVVQAKKSGDRTNWITVGAAFKREDKLGVRGNKNKKIRKADPKSVKCHEMHHLQVNKSPNKHLPKLLTRNVYYA